MWKLLTLGVLLAACCSPACCTSIFYSYKDANQVLKIQKRANSFLEEVKPGSLERECREETCDFEEASEIFETKEATLEFWNKYVEVKYNNCSVNNGGCQHFCKEDPAKQCRYCSCASGYQLMNDHNMCTPVVEFPCGRVKMDYTEGKAEFNIRLIGGHSGGRGFSPWQVSAGLLPMKMSPVAQGYCSRNAAGQCRGSVSFSADEQCSVGTARVHHVGKCGKYHRLRTEASEQTIWVDKYVRHDNYSKLTSDNDIAMLHLAEPVMYNKYALPICLPTRDLAEHELTTKGRPMLVTGWGSTSDETRNYSALLSYIEIPIVPKNECAQVMTNMISDNMLCAGSLGDRKDSCSGDSGGPMATKYKDTWFLVGLVSWGEGCGRKEKFGVYTKFDFVFLVFVRKDAAHEVLRVHKRANYFLEEIRPGNLERECSEEKCSFEEAKEIFHSQEKTMEFWFNYKGLNPCTTNPCKNGGVCKIRHYNYFCICPPKFGGDNCEKEKLECWYKNGGCWQYCWDSGSFQVQCSCAKDYTLHEDGKQCVQAGDFDKYQRELKEQKIGVERSWTHPHYDSNNYNGDIALLYLSSEVVFNEYAVPICLPSPRLAALLAEEGRAGTVSGWGATHSHGSTLRFLMRVRLPIVSMDTCQRSTARLVTDNMFCAGYGTEAADACKGDSGGPFAASYHGTWFLLGVVSWGDGCAERGKYGVYTRVSNYIPWIKETVESVADAEEFTISFA
ncbi:hypothetical protein ASZ78_007555 [Callipepla squamata]|uniref:Vitamin K-dependent protein C n=2 Tax=Callipepla squamata TaxID=9009 RepID=A0A226MUA8_CALSU|nr:hypothetical protein ASZ78_007555 [Callipepla squamata]